MTIRHRCRWRPLRRLTIFLGLVAAGVAQGGLFSHKPDPHDLAGLQHVVVFARLGDTFHASWVGLTIFNNKFFDAPVPEWGIDPFVEQTVHDDLAALGHFSADPLDVSGLDLPTLYRKKGAVTNSKEVIAVLLERAKQQGADALLIVDVWHWQETHPFHGTGFGAYRRDFYPSGCIYTAFMTTLFRVDSAKRVMTAAEPPPCEVSKTDAFEKKKSWDDYSAEEKAAFESAVKQKVRETLAGHLSQLGLTEVGVQK